MEILDGEEPNKTTFTCSTGIARQSGQIEMKFYQKTYSSRVRIQSIFVS